VKAGVKAEGACITDINVSQACEFNLSEVAATAGFDCLGENDDTIFQTCVREGDGGQLKGVLGVATEMSSDCADCYAASVLCSKKFCLGQCAGAATSDACVQCRITNDCTSSFYACSGFPTPAELNP
jgi:hypothetical protein